MDDGKGGQTRSLQEREDDNKKQTANLGRNEKPKFQEWALLETHKYQIIIIL